jgi:SHS family sialic acid transporter-like MFS transporter
MTLQPTPPTTVDDVYARRSFYRWLALVAALLAWTFDGVEQGVYMLRTREALKELIPSVSEEVRRLNEINDVIQSKAGTGAPVSAEKAESQKLSREIDTELSKYFGFAFAMWLWGAAAGGIIFGRMGDRYGRVRSLMFAVITYSIFTGISAFSGHWSHLTACRFLGALGLGGAWPLSVAILVETWPDKHRGVLAGLMGAGANVGFLVAATYSGIMENLGYDWRWVFGMGFFIGASSLALIAFVPETTKWKIARQQARPSSFKDVFTRRYRRSTIVGSLLSTVALLGTWGSFLWLATYVDQITEGTEFQGSARNIVSRWQAYGQIIGGFLGGLLAKWMGSKTSWCFLCVSAWATVFALFGLNDQFGLRMVWMAAFAGLFVTAFFGWLPKFLPELYPTRIRATGQGFSFNIGRILTGLGVLGAGALVNVFGGNYQKGMMVIASIYLVGLVIIWFAPETGGKMVSDDEESGGAAAR